LTIFLFDVKSLLQRIRLLLQEKGCTVQVGPLQRGLNRSIVARPPKWPAWIIQPVRRLRVW